GKHTRGSQAGAGGAPANDAVAAARNPGSFPPMPERGTLPPQAVGGVLAGRVIDGYNQAPPGAFIQVTLLEDSGKPAAAPIEVSANAQGYFVIPGLQTGKHYQLTARSRDGGRVLAGTSLETPPNPKVLIR